MFAPAIKNAASALLETCRKKNLRLTAAESCTGGLLSALLTEIPGSSDVFECGFVTYADASKTAMLGIEKSLIAERGAVSDSVASAMAQGALERAKADIAVAITGIAGPGGATEEKPVGLVYVAVATRESSIVENNHFTGTRTDIRAQSVAKALAMLDDVIARIPAEWRGLVRE